MRVAQAADRCLLEGGISGSLSASSKGRATGLTLMSTPHGSQMSSPARPTWTHGGVVVGAQPCSASAAMSQSQDGGSRRRLRRGHATIATAVALAGREGTGDLVLRTSTGEVRVQTRSEDGRIFVTLSSVAPAVRDVDEGDLDTALAVVRWDRTELDPGLPPRIVNAGNDHLILAAGSRERLASLDYDMGALGDLMERRGWTTVHLVLRESDEVFHTRDPFPPGGVVEDPATGAAAADLGAYLRDLALVSPPALVTIHQGEDMGRPSRLLVDIPQAPPPKSRSPEPPRPCEAAVSCFAGALIRGPPVGLAEQGHGGRHQHHPDDGLSMRTATGMPTSMRTGRIQCSPRLVGRGSAQSVGVQGIGDSFSVASSRFCASAAVGSLIFSKR